MTRGAEYLSDIQAFGRFLPRVYTDKITLEGNVADGNSLTVTVKLAIRDRLDKLGNALVNDNTSMYYNNIVVDVVVIQSADWAEMVINGNISLQDLILRINNWHGHDYAGIIATAAAADASRFSAITDDPDMDSWPIGKHTVVGLHDVLGGGTHEEIGTAAIEVKYEDQLTARQELHYSTEVSLEFPGDPISDAPSYWRPVESDEPMGEMAEALGSEGEDMAIVEATATVADVMGSPYVGTYPDNLYVFCAARIETETATVGGVVDFQEMGLEDESMSGFLGGFGDHLYGDVTYDRIIRSGTRLFEQPFYFTAEDQIWTGPVILGRDGRYYKAEKITNEMIIEEVDNGLVPTAMAVATSDEPDDLATLYLQAIGEITTRDEASPDLLNNLRALLPQMSERSQSTRAGSIYNSLSSIVSSYTNIANNLGASDRLNVQMVRNGKIRDSRSGYLARQPNPIARPAFPAEVAGPNYVSAHLPWDVVTKEELGWTGDAGYWTAHEEGSSQNVKNLLRHRSVSAMKVINEENLIYYKASSLHRDYLPKLTQLFGFPYLKGHCYISEVEINRRHSETWDELVNEAGQPNYYGFYYREQSPGVFGGRYSEYEKGNIYEEGAEMNPCVRARLYTPSIIIGEIDTEGEPFSFLQRTGQMYLNPEITMPAPNPDPDTEAESYFGLGSMAVSYPADDPEVPIPDVPATATSAYDSFRDWIRSVEYTEFLENLAGGEQELSLTERQEYGHYGSGIYFEASPLNIMEGQYNYADNMPRRLMLYFNEPVVGMMQTENEMHPPAEPAVAYEHTLYITEVIGLIFQDIWWFASNALLGLGLYKDTCETRCASHNITNDFNEWFGEAWYNGDVINSAGWSPTDLGVPAGIEVTGFDRTDASTWPWTRAAAAYVLMLDVLGNHYGGDFGIMQDEVKAICDRINPMGGSLNEVESFYDQLSDTVTSFYEKFKGTEVDISYLGEGFEGATYWDWYVDATLDTLDCPAFTRGNTVNIDSDELVDLSTAFDAFEEMYARQRDQEHEDAMEEWFSSEESRIEGLEIETYEKVAKLERGIIAFIRGSPADGYETGEIQLDEVDDIESAYYGQTKGPWRYSNGLWASNGGAELIANYSGGWKTADWCYSLLQMFQAQWLFYANDTIHRYTKHGGTRSERNTTYRRNFHEIMRDPAGGTDQDITDIVQMDHGNQLRLGSSESDAPYTTKDWLGDVTSHPLVNCYYWMCNSFFNYLPKQTADYFNAYKRSVMMRWQVIMANYSSCWENAMAIYIYGNNSSENISKIREEYTGHRNLGNLIWPVLGDGSRNSAYLLSNLGYTRTQSSNSCLNSGNRAVACSTEACIAKLAELQIHWGTWKTVIHDLQNKGVWPIPTEVLSAYLSEEMADVPDKFQGPNRYSKTTFGKAPKFNWS